MLIEGTFAIGGTRDQVWAALTDLPAAAPLFPGCETIEPAGEGVYRAVAVARVGPIKTRLIGKITVVEQLSGESMATRVEGQDAVTGSHVRANLRFSLASGSAGSTDVRYTADVLLAGRLGNIAHAIVRETAAVMLDEFVRRLNARVTGVTSDPKGLGALGAQAAARSLKAGVASLFDRKEGQS
jgi:carbon monoxide dehydrogenase subunit G